jgi:hypothetical protein
MFSQANEVLLFKMTGNRKGFAISMVQFLTLKMVTKHHNTKYFLLV